MSGVGWGSGEWGSGSYGGFSAGPLQLLSAIAVRENVVTLQFSRTIYFSGILDPHDAGALERYTIQAVQGTVGIDGEPVHEVLPAAVELTPDLPPGAQVGTLVDLSVDQPFSPWPALYTVTVNGIWTADQSTIIDAGATAYTFPGVHNQLVIPQIDTPSPSRDIGNPQTLSMALDPLPNPFDPSVLGTFNTGDDGDYAFDEGLTGYKKRIIRRLVTKPGGFAHLGQGYGVGILTHGKRLALARTQAQIISAAQQQIAREPETASVKVGVVPNPANNGLVRFSIAARMRGGQTTKFTAPFPAG